MHSEIVKTVGLLVVLMAIVVYADPKAFAKAREDCSKELKLSAAEIEMVQSDRLYSKQKFSELPKSVQCYTQCFYKKINLLGANNALDEKATKTALTAFYKGDAKQVETLMEKCKAEMTKGANDCEKTFNYEVCVHKP